MKANTYRLYQMKNTPEMKSFIHQSFRVLIAMNYHPALQDYDLAASGLLGIEDNLRAVCEKIRAKQVKSQAHRAMGTGDILVIKNDAVICYFYDTMGFAVLDDFYMDEEESAALRLSIDSRNVSLPGRSGHWDVINSIAVETTSFFLLQSVEYGGAAAWLIADGTGDIIIDDNRTDFDGKTVQRLRQYLRPELSSSPPKQHFTPANPHKADDAGCKGQLVIEKRVSLRLRLGEKLREIQTERQEKQLSTK